MKQFANKLFNYFVLLALLSAFCACQEEEENFRISDVKISPSNSSFTSLDQILINLEVDGSVSSLTVAQVGGDEIGSASISGGEGTFTTSPNNIDFDDSGNASLEFIASVEGGEQVRDVFEISISNPVSITPPSGVVQNDMEHYFHYDIVTENSDPEQVMVETKVNSGDYSEASGEWAQTDSVQIVGSNYEVEDTVYVRVTGLRGELSASMESSTVVGMNTFANESEPITFQGDTAYNLVGNAYAPSGTDTSDVEFVLEPVTNNLGFESNNGTQFVEATQEDYNTGNVSAIESKYQDGNKMSNVNGLETGDVFIFGTMRDNNMHLGIMHITDTRRTPSDDDTDSFTFTYKFN